MCKQIDIQYLYDIKYIYIYVYLTHVNEQHLYIYQTFFCVFNLFFSSILIYITSSIATSFQCDSVSLVKIYLMGNRGKSFQSSNNRVIQPPELTSHLKTGCGCPMIYTYNIYICIQIKWEDEKTILVSSWGTRLLFWGGCKLAIAGELCCHWIQMDLEFTTFLKKSRFILSRPGSTDQKQRTALLLIEVFYIYI